MSNAWGSGATRREPRQRRSREIVRAILEAGRLLLEKDGPDALTTNRIAERAGVSIGSLYRYFDDKEAVLAALYDRELARELETIEEAAGAPLAGVGLREGLEQLVDFQLERHGRMLSLESAFYRDHHRDFSLARRMGARAVEEIMERFFDDHADEIRVRDRREAAFLVGRGISAIVRQVVEERPEHLGHAAFRAELVDLLTLYLTGRR